MTVDRLEEVRAIIDNMLLSQNDIEERRCGYVHLYGVAQICALLGMKGNLSVELCSIIGMLHDFSSYKYGDNTNHAALSSIEAEHILRQMGSFSAEDIRLIVTAISNHSAKTATHDVYSETLKDADVFQGYLYNPKLRSVDNRVQYVTKELNITICEDEPRGQATGDDA